MNPLAIRIAADLKAFKANMQEMKLQLETNQAAMKRMASAFDGNKVIGDANAMVKAIHDIGGASKLTDTEMKRVNSTVTEAIAKYKALGREAPPELLALRDATNKVESATKQVAPPVDSLSTKLKGLAGMFGIAFGGAAVISGIKSLISNTFEYAETIKDTSAKLAISMDFTQRWKFAAEQTGASLENVSKSVLKLSQGVAGNDKALKEALASAGLEFDKLKGMKPEDAFTLVADAIAKIPDPMLQADVALAAFGKSGAELLPALREGALGLAADVKTMSDKTINDLDRAKDAWGRMENAVTVATGGMLGKISIFLEKIAPRMQLLFTLMGDTQSAEMWSAFSKGADQAADSVNRLTESEKRYADELIKKFGKPAVAAMSPLFAEYVKSLEPVPPASDRARESTVRLTKELDKLKMTLPGVKESDGVRAFFDSLRIGNDRLLMTLPGVTGSVQEFIASVRVGNDVIEDAMQRLPGVAEQGAAGFVAALEARNDDIRSVGQKWGDALSSSFSKALEGLGGVILGAIQGGGDVARSAFAHLGQSLGADLAKGILGDPNTATGLLKGLTSLIGPLGAIAGNFLGGIVGKLFQGNDTKKAREQAAHVMGFPSLDAMYQALRATGEEGAALVHQALNVIGKTDTAANQQWIEAMKAVFDKQKEAASGAAKAIEDAAAREIAATNKVKDAILAKIDVLDSEHNSVFNSIKDELDAPEYDEAGNRIYGVIEAQGLARLEEIEKQKAALSEQLAEASAKVMDQAVICKEGIEAIFKEPIRVMFDFSDWKNMPGASSGPAGSSPSWFGGGSSIPASSGGGMATSHITVVIPMDGEVVAQKTVTHTAKLLPRQLQFVGATQG